MKISEYIEELQKILQAEGDLLVTGSRGNGVGPVFVPQVMHLRKMKGRERKQEYYYSFDGEDRKGEKVVCV